MGSSKEGLRVCAYCSAKNVDEVNCWMCQQPLPPAPPRVVRRVGKPPEEAEGQVHLQQIPVFVVSMLMVCGSLGGGGWAVLLGMALIPALLVTALANRKQEPGKEPEAIQSTFMRVFGACLKILLAIWATMLVVGIMLFIACISIVSSSGHH